MRSAALLLCTQRRAQRRPPRGALRERPDALRRTALRDAARRAPGGARRALSRTAKPRERIVHVIPRGFLPLVRH